MSHNHGGSSSMVGMGGMDMSGGSSSSILMQPTNKYITKIFWCLISAVLAVGLVAQLLQIYDSRSR
jgi:hypothetical protein